MNRIDLRIWALAAVALAATGCQTAPPPEGGYRIDNQNYVSPTLNTVRVIDDSLARFKNSRYDVQSILDVERVNLSRSETGFPRISVELRNKTGFDIPLVDRTSWYDAAGRPVLVLGGGEPGFIESRPSLRTRIEHWIAGQQHRAA